MPSLSLTLVLCLCKSMAHGFAFIGPNVRSTFATRLSSSITDDGDDDLNNLRRFIAQNDEEWYREFVTDVLGEDYTPPLQLYESVDEEAESSAFENEVAKAEATQKSTDEDVPRTENIVEQPISEKHFQGITEVETVDKFFPALEVEENGLLGDGDVAARTSINLTDRVGGSVSDVVSDRRKERTESEQNEVIDRRMEKPVQDTRTNKEPFNVDDDEWMTEQEVAIANKRSVERNATRDDTNIKMLTEKEVKAIQRENEVSLGRGNEDVVTKQQTDHMRTEEIGSSAGATESGETFGKSDSRKPQDQQKLNIDQGRPSEQKERLPSATLNNGRPDLTNDSLNDPQVRLSGVNKGVVSSSTPLVQQSAHDEENGELVSQAEQKSEGYSVHFRDPYSSQRTVKIVPLKELADLGYRVGEISNMQSDALDLIVQDKIQKPSRGIPPHWMVSRNQPNQVQIIERTGEINGDSLKNEKSIETIKNGKEMAENNRAEEKRGSRDSVSETREVANKHGESTRSRSTRSRRPRAKRNDSRLSRRASNVPGKRIYSGQGWDVEQGRSPGSADPPGTRFWMNLDKFRYLLGIESELRLRILGDGWTDAVRDEANWRLDNYSKWLDIVNKGIGDSIYETPRQRQSTKERQATNRAQRRRNRNSSTAQEYKDSHQSQRVPQQRRRTSDFPPSNPKQRRRQ